jgi:flavin reductase (DIM6/NTAB) family NADH-FMN oxidoreductase RutF
MPMNDLSQISFNEIMALEKEKRTTFVNSLNGFKTVGLIGTKNKNGQTNLAIFNSFIHLGANPPLIGFICRPSSVERHTLENIFETGFFTINHINENILKQSHQTSARYARNQSEFEETGLAEEYKNDFFAPFVKESNVQIGMGFKEKIEIPINNIILIIGQIAEVYFPTEILKTDGFLDLEVVNSIISCGLDSYHKTKKLERLSYAKVGKVLETMKQIF